MLDYNSPCVSKPWCPSLYKSATWSDPVSIGYPEYIYIFPDGSHKYYCWSGCDYTMSLRDYKKKLLLCK